MAKTEPGRCTGQWTETPNGREFGCDGRTCEECQYGPDGDEEPDRDMHPGDWYHHV